MSPLISEPKRNTLDQATTASQLDHYARCYTRAHWEQAAYDSCSAYPDWKRRITYAWGFLEQATKELDLQSIQAVQRGLDRSIHEVQP